MKSPARQNSELKPPENITPSTKTTINGILVLLPLSLFLLGLFTGIIDL
ncbi:MAG: purine permease [Waterburya sp.]